MEMYGHASRANSAELGTEKSAVQSRPKNDLEGVTKYSCVPNKHAGSNKRAGWKMGQN